MIIKCAWFVRLMGFVSAGVYGWQHARACAFWPFVVIRGEEYVDEYFINHEKIHLKQQVELLFVGLIVWDILETLFWMIRGKSLAQAYLLRSSEQEAYQNQHNLIYLQSRHFLEIKKYLKNKMKIVFQDGKILIEDF